MAVSVLSGVESHWRNVQYELTEYSYKERMLYLVLNSDDTFEMRWIDYFSISGFDEIQKIDE